MRLVVVIPATRGREENLLRVIASLRAQERAAEIVQIIVVDDGGGLEVEAQPGAGVEILYAAKHHPGMEQPRNKGVRWARRHQATHVWFVDSDVVLVPEALTHIAAAIDADPGRILVCPYEWLSDGVRRPEDDFAYIGQVHNDPRTAMFSVSPPERVYRNDLSAGLACFTGNLVWPIADFEHVGGFWNELHHGRCEDGELGLRAVAMKVPISLVAAARGYHIYHDRDHARDLERNRRDVPMLNARHPWVQDAGVDLVLDRDGAAFDVRCPCGEVVPTIGWWAHAADCTATNMELPV